MSGCLQRRRERGGWCSWVLLVALAALGPGVVPALGTAPALAQAPGPEAGADPQQITVGVGNAIVLERDEPLRRVVVTDPEIAEAMVVSGTEVVLQGRSIGTTTLLLWSVDGERELLPVVVTPDAAALERQLRSLFPGQQVRVEAIGTALVLSGEVQEGRIAQQVREVAEAAGFEVIDRLAVPAPDQVLLQVRIAEVSRSALREVGVQWLVNRDGRTAAVGAQPFSGRIEDGEFRGTFSDALNLFLFDPELDLAAFIRALEAQGAFRSLAEPNLLTLAGEEASFLAGGEFPFPVVQGGGTATPAVTIEFREFGVRLNFLPLITEAGNIRLQVAPEVSTLDFANGLQLSGFRVPSVLARRAETEVVLRAGQTLAIAGLLDHSITENVDRIPLLGRIPVLGALFRSRELRQQRTELVVLVTPHLVQPSASAPPLPAGEPEEWEWLPPLRRK